MAPLAPLKKKRPNMSVFSLVVLRGLSLNQLHRWIRLAKLMQEPGQAQFKKPPPRRARRLSMQERAVIIEEYKAGESMARLGLKHKVSRHTISELLKRSGVEARQPKVMREAEVTKAVNLYEAGYSLKEIGELLGFDAETIRQKLIKRGVQTRRPWER